MIASVFMGVDLLAVVVLMLIPLLAVCVLALNISTFSRCSIDFSPKLAT